MTQHHLPQLLSRGTPKIIWTQYRVFGIGGPGGNAQKHAERKRWRRRSDRGDRGTRQHDMTITPSSFLRFFLVLPAFPHAARLSRRVLHGSPVFLPFFLPPPSGSSLSSACIRRVGHGQHLDAIVPGGRSRRGEEHTCVRPCKARKWNKQTSNALTRRKETRRGT